MDTQYDDYDLQYQVEEDEDERVARLEAARAHVDAVSNSLWPGLRADFWAKTNLDSTLSCAGNRSCPKVQAGQGRCQESPGQAEEGNAACLCLCLLVWLHGSYF